MKHDFLGNTELQYVLGIQNVESKSLLGLGYFVTRLSLKNNASWMLGVVLDKKLDVISAPVKKIGKQ